MVRFTTQNDRFSGATATVAGALLPKLSDLACELIE
jgi:hypothetical protein